MTEVTVRTDDNPTDIPDVTPDVVEDHEMRLQELETDTVTDAVDHSEAMDIMSTRIRDLETRLEMATKRGSKDDSPPDESPDIPAVPEPEPPKPDEPEQPEVPDPDTTITEEPDDVPEVDPNDPTTNPALNPQGNVTEIENEVETPEVKKTTRVRKTKPVEDIPKQKKGIATFILGGSGGLKRNKRSKVSK